jgi:hypothetical protein
MHDNPVAMPGPYGNWGDSKINTEEYIIQQQAEKFTLEQFFKVCNDLEQESTVKSEQIGGDHYQKAALQPWDIFLAWGLDPWAANVVKYILRFPYKNGLEDLQKAKHYVDFLIEHYDEVHEKYYEKEI